MTAYQFAWSARLGAGSILAAASLIASPAFGATASSNLGVSATVSANCTISTSSVAFGTVNTISGSNTDATGSISVTCTNGAGWSAAAAAGGGTGATFATRKMTAGANVLNYTLYTDSGRTSVWGDGTVSTSVLSNTGTGVAQSVNVYGRVFSGQTSAPAGSYSDTVAVTVTY
jgi:spore coat protein U-like protein